MSQKPPNVLVAGDSFTYGSELQDKNNVYWKHIWPDAKCIAEPGHSNQAIARNVFMALASDTYDLVVVMWTFPSRYEFAFNVPTGHPGEFWHTPGTKIDTPEIQKFNTTFNKYVGTHSNYQLYTTYKEIYMIQSMCNQLDKDYIFLSADWSVNDVTSSMSWMIDGTKWFHPDDKKGFLNWAIDNKYERGPDQHPLDQAHIDYAKELKKWVG